MRRRASCRIASPPELPTGGACPVPSRSRSRAASTRSGRRNRSRSAAPPSLSCGGVRSGSELVEGHLVRALFHGVTSDKLEVVRTKGQSNRNGETGKGLASRRGFMPHFVLSPCFVLWPLAFVLPSRDSRRIFDLRFPVFDCDLSFPVTCSLILSPVLRPLSRRPRGRWSAAHPGRNRGRSSGRPRARPACAARVPRSSERACRRAWRSSGSATAGTAGCRVFPSTRRTTASRISLQTIACSNRWACSRTSPSRAAGSGRI